MIKQLSLLLTLALVFVTPVPAENFPPGIIQLKPYTAPALTLNDIDGIPFKIEETRGKWLFVHFWASWCRPCRREMPTIQKMWNIMQNENLALALINTAENEDTVFSFLSSHAPDIRPLMDLDGQVTEAWKPRGLPATYLVDPQGIVRYQALGGRDWDTSSYLAFLRNLIKK